MRAPVKPLNFQPGTLPIPASLGAANPNRRVAMSAAFSIPSRQAINTSRFMNDLFSRIVKATVGGTAVFLAIIFIPAGTVDYWQGWAFAGTLMVSSLLVTIYMALNDRELLESRLRMGPTAEKTSAQKVITAVGFVVFVAALVIVVLDQDWPGRPAFRPTSRYWATRSPCLESSSTSWWSERIGMRPHDRGRRGSGGRLDRPLRDYPAPDVRGRHSSASRNAACARLMVGPPLHAAVHWVVCLASLG